MSAKTNAASDLISVPSGGGALKGLGEKFSADPHTGAGSFSVPLTLPSGRNGFQPQLTLSFSAGSGNGPFGLGWSVGIPGISRLSSKGIPRYRDSGSRQERDTFVLSGAEDLVETEEASGGDLHSYRPRTEGLFARIARHLSSSPGSETDHWSVQTKDGLTSTYGSPNQSVAGDGSDQRAVVADPRDRRKIFAWRLTETRDPFGNRIVYDYRRDVAIGAGRNWDQLYVSRVRYVDLTGADQQPFLVSVEFLYDDDADPPGAAPESGRRTRPDPFSDYRAGFEIRTRRRCKWIVVRTHPAIGRDLLVRAYELMYLDETATDSSALPPNGVSLLSRVNVVGYDDDGVAHRELAPIDFSYSGFAPERRRLVALTGSPPLTTLANPALELVDLFGRGLPDLVEFDGDVRYWRNLGQGRFDMPRSFMEAPTAARLAEAGVQLLDADGDGRTDLVVTTGTVTGYWPLDFRAEFSRKPFHRYRQAPSFNLEDPEVRLIDLTGDGVTDVLRSGTFFECFFNDASEGWLPQNVTRVQRQALDAFPNVTFSDPRVKFADMTGDGLQDIAVVYEGHVDYWPNLGYGRWGDRISMTLAQRLPTSFDPGRVLLADVDGDGLADLIYVSDREVTLWINRTGNGWSDARTIRGTPAVNLMVAVRVTDLLGTGVPGVLWTRDLEGSGRVEHLFLDFTGGNKPYLLNRIDNNLGAVTDVAYASSAVFYLRDARSPDTKWRTTLPFPVQVVERTKVTDVFSEGVLTTEYRYHHGYWDGVEREFRGFGMVEQIDTEVFDGYAGRRLSGNDELLQPLLAQQSFCPPILTRTWFHQGPLDPADDGRWYDMDWSGEFWPGDSDVLEQGESTNAFLATLPPGAQRDALRALRGQVLRREVYALDGSALQDRPYTVTERSYALREESAPAPDEDRQRIFFPHLVTERVTQWERGGDPMARFSYTSGYDDVGQATRQLSIACPRGWRGVTDTPPQGFLATISHSAYAVPLDAGVYIRDRIARMRSFEILDTAGLPLMRVAATDEASPNLRLLAESLNFFDATSDPTTGYGAFIGLPAGHIGRFGALVRTETLVMTPADLTAAYDAPPPYLLPGSAFQGDSEYPASFVHAMPALAGYVYREASAAGAEGYFAVSTCKRYDFHSAVGSGQGLVLGQRDPLMHESRIDYDVFGLLPIAVHDPADLVTLASYNLRTLLPAEVTDCNGNLTRLVYSPSGLVTDAWTLGKPAAPGSDGQNAGDRTLPGVHIDYDWLAFQRSRLQTPDGPQPVVSRTVRRVFHDSDPDDTGETVEAREYSDGFGRLLQTRAQSDDVVFGDLTFGGGEAVLPADPAGGPGDIVEGRNRASDFATTVLSDEPIAFYRMNEPAAASVAVDAAGHSNNGTYSASGITLGVQGLGAGDTAVKFDGAGPGRLVVNDNATLNPARITMEALVRWDGPNGFQQRILEKSFGTGWPERTAYGLSILDDGRAHVEIATGADYAVSGTAAIARGAATHLAATYDGATLAIYVNGALAAWQPASGDLRTTPGSQVGVGNQVERDRPFNGVIDEVALYAAALTADRIQAHARLLGFGGHSTDPVVVSGWQRYDNKGQVIAKFEPFWSAGWNYAPPADAEFGQKATFYYDARGQVMRTVSPDGSEQRVIHGVPTSLDDPPLDPADTDKFTPTPWEAYTYDANDNAGRTPAADPDAARYRHHWNTPASIEVDALGRTVRAVARNRDAPASATSPLPGIDEYVTRSTYDIQGNITEFRDQLGRLAFRTVYDLASRALRRESIDSGSRREIFDASGNPVEARDGRAAIRLRAYDLLNRPLCLWARDAPEDAVTLRERTVYGDSADAPGAIADKQTLNVLGRPWRSWDEAGVVTSPAYDFMGRGISTTRQVLSDDFVLSDIRSQSGPAWTLRAPRVDWEASTPPGLDGYVYESRSSFDALGRVKVADYPVCANGNRYRMKPTFSRAGRLESIALLGPLDASGQGPSQAFVERIAYNAKGQRVLVSYGNGLMTRHAYDAKTFRLARTRTERFVSTGTATYKRDGQPLQDLVYTYDLIGNIVATVDRTPGSGVVNNLSAALAGPALQTMLAAGDALLREFAYDPLYRLVSVSGRECADIPGPRPSSDDPRCGYNSGSHGTPNQDNAPYLCAFYREQYDYDPSGNMTRLRHGGAGPPSWVRVFGMSGFKPAEWQQKLSDWKQGSVVDWGQDGNRLTNVGDGDDEAGVNHSYDANGYMLAEQTERHFEWDHANRMKVFRNQAGTSRPTVYAVYLYDSGGRRIKKVVVSGTRFRTTTYLGASFEHHRRIETGATVENCLLHIMDGTSRIAIKRSGPAFADDGAGEHAVQFHIADHLGSVGIVVSDDGAWINREEFFPYGETSFGSFGRKRFRYTGVERDEESGLSYHRMRYMNPGLNRWIGPDPSGARDGANLYAYGRDNPIGNRDSTGLACDSENQSCPATSGSDTGAQAAAGITKFLNLACRPSRQSGPVTEREFQEMTRKELARSSRRVVNERALNTAGRVSEGTPDMVDWEGRLSTHTHPNEPPSTVGGVAKEFPAPSIGTQSQPGDVDIWWNGRYRDNLILRPSGVTYFRVESGVPYVTVYNYTGKDTAYALVHGSTRAGFWLTPVTGEEFQQRMAVARAAAPEGHATPVDTPAVRGAGASAAAEGEGLLVRRASFGLLNGSIFLLLAGFESSPHVHGNYDYDQAELDYALGARPEPAHLTRFWQEREARAAQRQAEGALQGARDAEIRGLSVPGQGASFSE